MAISATVLHAQTPQWKTDYDSAQRYWGSDWRKTVPFLVKAEKSALYDLGLYDENYLTILNDLGLAYAKAGDYANAEKMLTKAIGIRNEVEPDEPADIQKTLLNLATIYAEQNRLQDAENIYSKLNTDPRLDDALAPLVLKSTIALLETSNKISQALSLLADPKFVKFVTSPEWTLIRARLLRENGQFSESMQTLETIAAGPKPVKPEDQSLHIQWLEQVALNHLETGYLQHAESKLLEAQKLIRTGFVTDHATHASILNALATVYEKLGLRDKALMYYQEALPHCEKEYGPSSVNTLTLRSNVAGIYLARGQAKQAIELYQSAEQQLASATTESNPVYITVLNNLGTAYRANHELVKARAMFQRALSLIEKYGGQETDLAASVMNNLAVLLTTEGKFRDAATYYEKAYAIRKSIYGTNPVKLMDLAGNLAVVYWELGKTDQSLPLFEQSAALALRHVKYIFPNLSENEQVQFYRKLREDFERFNAIAFRASSKRPELLIQAFNNQLTLKSLRFFTQQHRADVATQKKDTILLRQFEQLRQKRDQLGQLYQFTLRQLSQSPVSTGRLEQEIDGLEKSISMKTSASVADKMQADQLTWGDIQQGIDGEEALIEVIRYRKYDLRSLVSDEGARAMFGFTDSVYYAALVTTRETKAHPALVLIKDGVNMEKRYLNYYRNALNYRVADVNSYNAYWKPIAPHVKDKRKVYFAGDGVYHQVNLNTISNPATNQFLTDLHDIRYLLNPAQYRERRSPTLEGNRAFLFGDPNFDGPATSSVRASAYGQYPPLPGTRTEVTEIDALLRGKGWNTMVRLKDQATEHNFKATSATNILHVATHGFFTKDKIGTSKSFQRDVTFNSGLLLNGANTSLRQETTSFHDDGILTAYEVANLNLSGTSLVVLSACETGLGNIEIGEGVYGLQRSFLQAGARNVLISLWKVNDDITRQLMTSFYTHLVRSPNIHDALSKAQQEIRVRYPEPVAWGSFILVGK